MHVLKSQEICFQYELFSCCENGTFKTNFLQKHFFLSEALQTVPKLFPCDLYTVPTDDQGDGVTVLVSESLQSLLS